MPCGKTGNAAAAGRGKQAAVVTAQVGGDPQRAVGVELNLRVPATELGCHSKCTSGRSEKRIQRGTIQSAVISVQQRIAAENLHLGSGILANAERRRQKSEKT